MANRTPSTNHSWTDEQLDVLRGQATASGSELVEAFRATARELARTDAPEVRR